MLLNSVNESIEIWLWSTVHYLYYANKVAVQWLLKLVDVDLVESHAGQHVLGQLGAVLALNHHPDVCAAVLGISATQSHYLRRNHT